MTRVATGPDPQLTDLQFAPTNQSVNPCPNANPASSQRRRSLPDDRDGNVSGAPSMRRRCRLAAAGCRRLTQSEGVGRTTSP